MSAKGKSQKYCNWSEDQLITLIAAYETENVLYDDSNPKYFNQKERINAYSRIQNIMLSRFNENYSLRQIKKKVCYLRSSFISETRKRNSLIAAGQCTKESYTPTWWCYGIINFLDDFINLGSIKKIWNKNCKKVRILSKSNEQHKSTSEDSVIEVQNEKNKKSKDVDEPKSSDDSMSETEVPNKKKRVQRSKTDDDDQHMSSDDSLFDTEVPNENDDFTVEETESENNFPKIISNSQNGASKLDEMSMHSENSDFESSSLEVQCLRLQEIQDELERRTVPRSTSQPTRIEIDDNESSSAMDSLKSTTEVEARQISSSDLQTTLENVCPGPDAIFKASIPKRPKLSDAKDSNLLPEQTPATQIKYDRENIFGQYVATELKTIRDNPLLYLKTKQAILEIMTKASFNLISSE